MKLKHHKTYGHRLLTILLASVAISCSSPAPKPESPLSKNTTTSYFKTLLVIGDDRSGSTSDIRKLTADDYQTLISAIGQKGGGTVAVCLIGNPTPQSREPYLISLSSLENIKPFDPKSQELTLTEKGHLKKINEDAARANKVILDKQQTEILDFIENTIKPNIIDYAPSGKDNTDLNDAISRISTLINEPQYKDYDKIIVALISDGKNEPASKEKTIGATLSGRTSDIYLVGWETDINCFTGQPISQMSSKDGFIENIKNLKTK